MNGSLIVAVVSDRVAGMSYKLIASRHGISVPKVRQCLTHAVRDGLANPDTIRYEPPAPRPIPDGSYDANWVERVLSQIKVVETGCWVWQGRVGTWGYGSFPYSGKDRNLHRMFYQVVNKVQLDRWQLVMHKCDQRLCLNLAHLRIGTPSENVEDAANKGRHHNARKTQCKRGHVYTPETVYVTPAGTRACRLCHNGKLRIKAGWPEHLAYSIGTVPHGYTVDFQTGEFRTTKGLLR